MSINSRSASYSVSRPVLPVLSRQFVQKGTHTHQLNLKLKEKLKCFEDLTDKMGNTALNDYGYFF